jgi:single-stranded DNA-binding protein
MSDTAMTIAGNLVAGSELRFTPAGQPVDRFRVASTPRFRDNATGVERQRHSVSDGEPVAADSRERSRVLTRGRV